MFLNAAVHAQTRRCLLGATLALITGNAAGAPGDRVGPPFQVSSDPTAVFSASAIARSRDGDFVALLSGDSQLVARSFAADGTPRTENFPIFGGRSQGDIAVNDDGTVAACWLQVGPDGGPSVYARRFAEDGEPLGDPVIVGGPRSPLFGGVTLGGCAIAMDRDGNFVVAWTQGQVRRLGEFVPCDLGRGLCVEFDDYAVKLRRYTSGGTRATLTRTLARFAEYRATLFTGVFGGSEMRNVDVDMAPDGTFVAAWEAVGEQAALHLLDGTYAQRFSPLGLPGLPQIVSLKGTTLLDATIPSVSMADDGSYVVAYRTRTPGLDDLSRNVSARLYPAFGFAGREFQVNDGGANQAASLDTAMDAAGNFVVGWRNNSGDIREGFVQRHARGGGALGVNFVVNPDAPNALVAMSGNGDFLVSWSDRDTAQAMIQLFEGP